MTTVQIPVQIHKKKQTLTPNKIAMYRQMKIMEAFDDDQQFYYLFFYKNNFLTGLAKKAIPLGSSIHQAFTNGIIFDGCHPIIQAIIKQYTNMNFTTLKQLYKKVTDKYAPIEKIYILTTLDAFISSDEVHELLKKDYNSYRRNGQNTHAAQLLTMYLHYHTDTFASDMLHELTQFTPSTNQMKKQTTHPVNTEIMCFDAYDQDNYMEKLLSIYQSENRWLDELIIRIQFIKYQFTSQNLTHITKLIGTFNHKTQISFLQSLGENTEIQTHLVNELLADENDNEVTQYIISHPILVPSELIPKIVQSIKHTDTAILSSLYHGSSMRLLAIFGQDPQLLNQICTRFITAFLNVYSFEVILDWFLPFHQANIQLPIEQKVHKLHILENDPDKQFVLGKIYIEFYQYEKAIDCFKWEMELNPDNPEPVKLLSKVYKQLNKLDEATIYQQLWIQMEKGSVH